MCGRFTMSDFPVDLARVLGLALPASVKPRYNVAPTQEILAARQSPQELQEIQAAFAPRGKPEWATLRWGFPSGDGKFQVINARAETAHEKRMFAGLLKRTRCLVFADGFYEWQRDGSKKTPYLFRLKSRKPFAFAGLWDSKQVKTNQADCAVILTAAANDLVRPVHERMPVILDPGACKRWLDPATAMADLTALLVPYPADAMERVEVSSRVNNARVDDPVCIEPVQAGPDSIDSTVQQ